MVQIALKRIDWLLVAFIIPIILAGLFTMKSFGVANGGSSFFGKQIIWIILSFAVFFSFSFIDFIFLKRTNILVFIFLGFCTILLALFVLGKVSHGAQSWFDF